MRHTPVYEEEVLRALAPQKGKRYIDATLGEAGHLKKIIDSGAEVLAIDADPGQVRKAEKLFGDRTNVSFEAGNFSDIGEIAGKHGFVPADGILFDLGLSYVQIVNSGRGFSYKKTGELLDMRLDEDRDEPVQQIIKRYTVNQLTTMLMRNAEEIHAEKIAEVIVNTRSLNPVLTVGDLIACIDKALGLKDTKTYSRVFQAFRIEVNKEFETLTKGLENAWRILSPGGVLAVISFHSLEDRIVKRFITTIKNQIKSADKYKNYKNAQPFEKSALLRTIIKL